MSCRFLLMASIALNVALAGIAIGLTRRPVPPAPTPPLLDLTTNRPAPITAAATATSPVTPAVPSAPAAFEWSQVASTNLAQYAANLRAIECPKEIIREVILAAVNEDFVRRRHTLFKPIHAQFWELMAHPERFEHDNDENSERSKELRAERDAQLEAVLGPDWQRDAGPSPPAVYDYQPTHNTPQAGWAQNLAGFEATEEEYRALNQLRATTPTNAMSQFNAQAQALLGEERFALFQRGQDHRFAEILALGGRCQLPTNTVQFLYQQRVIAEQQCAQVLSNPGLSAEERRTMLLVIQSEARRQVFGILGETGGEAYVRHHGDWLGATAGVNHP